MSAFHSAGAFLLLGPWIRPCRALGFLLLLIVAFQGCTPREDIQSVSFTVDEGSWLSVDASSDGRWIVMDLLGEIWRLPMEGGAAQRITDVVRDSAEFLDPTFARDGGGVVAHGEYRGRRGVFRISLAGDTVRWIAPDSSQLGDDRLQLSHGPGRDSRHLLVAGTDSDGHSVLRERNIETGEERPIEILGVTGEGRDAPVYSSDETEIFFVTRRDWDEWGTSPIGGQVWRVPAVGGRARAITPDRLRAHAPEPSPDGSRIAYFVIDSLNRAQIRVQELDDSVGVQVTNDLNVTPTRVRWLPGGEELLYVESGRLWRLDWRSGRRSEIPFEATVDFVRRTPPLPALRLPSPGDRVREEGMRGYALSPDGRTLALISRDTLWVADTGIGATVRPMAAVPPSAMAPHWSPDGRVAWMAGPRAAEDLFVTDTVTRRTRRLTSLPGPEAMPAWSPDGRLIAYIEGDWASGSRARHVAIPVDDSLARAEPAIDLGQAGNRMDGQARWSPRSDAVLVLAPQGIGGGSERLASLRFLDGSPERDVRGLPDDISSARWLPGDTLVFLRATRLFRASFDVDAGVVGPAVPVSDEPVAFLEVSSGGDLAYVSEDGIRIRSRGGSPRHVGWPVLYTVPTPPPLLIRDVRLIEGTGAPPTAPKDVLVERGRIARIAPVGSITATAGIVVIDAGGRVATPGLIDLHSHHSTPAEMRGVLYYGVTTLKNLCCQAPSTIPDQQGTGLQPRIIRANARVDADWAGMHGGRAGLLPEVDPGHLQRAVHVASGLGTDVLKIYANSGWATQARTVAAAHRRGMRVTGHCAYPLTLVAAGIDSKEHLGFQCTVHDVGRWYDDLIQLYAHSGVSVIPTAGLFVTARLDGASRPLPSPVDELFTPFEREQLEESPIGSAAPANLDQAANVLDAARKLHRAGVLLGAGTDIERPDGMHYELEALVEASLSPLEAIAAATSVAARILGASEDIGRLAPGLLADFVIVDADPTVDIRNMRRVWAVIQGGHVVDRAELILGG